jgi:hypothetical protein
MSAYPEHDKLTAIKGEKEAVQSFIDWIDAQGWWIAEYPVLSEWVEVPGGEELQEYRLHQLRPVSKRPEQIMALHFGIDLDVLEAEKRQMLDEIRAAYAAREEATGVNG